MAGRLRTASRPSSTVMDDESYFPFVGPEGPFGPEVPAVAKPLSLTAVIKSLPIVIARSFLKVPTSRSRLARNAVLGAQRPLQFRKRLLAKGTPGREFVSMS